MADHQTPAERRIIEDMSRMGGTRQMDDLVKRARDCANGLGDPKNSRGDFGLFDDLADHIEALEAKNARLREYYEAREAISNVGLFFASDAMLKRENEARAALAEQEKDDE
jgi:hypothetical protein